MDQKLKRKWMRRAWLVGVCASLRWTGGLPAADAADFGSASTRPFPAPPAWVADQTLYEVNLRQFSADGNLDGLAKQLPRLRALGVGTLWIMPIHPIGVEGRSGELGSPYAVKDYTAVSPEFGTLQQFQSVVDQAHRLGMFVIMDWVAAHTARDHPWVADHPHWYNHDANGQLVPPLPSWTDVAGLNYHVPALRQEMIRSMAYWVRAAGIDGFRCDSAEFVPLDFWCDARDALRQIKPVFLLAEGSKPELTSYAFDASYAWNLPDNTEGIFKGTKHVADMINYFKADGRLLPGPGFRLNYTTNHDKNAWEGTTQQLLGGGTAAFTVLTFTAPGMPLIYDGQEAGLDRRLHFFNHDPIAWRDDPMAGLYRNLAALKRNHPALWDGLGSAPMQVIDGSTSQAVLSFDRQFQHDRVVVTLNLGPQPAQVPLPVSASSLPVVLGEETSTEESGTVSLQPWGYRVWSTAKISR